MLKRYIWFTVLGILVILSGCSNADEEELGEYMDMLDEEIEGNTELDESVDAYIDLIAEGKPEEAVEYMKETAIPKYEERLQKFEDLKIDSEDVRELHEHALTLMESDIEQQEILKRIFETIIGNSHIIEEIVFDDDLEALYETNEGTHEALKAFKETADDLYEKYDTIDVDDNAFAENVEDMDPSEVNELMDMLISEFVAIVVDGDIDTDDLVEDEAEEADAEENDEEDDGEAGTTDNADIDEYLDDRGNPHVVFEAEAKIDDKFYLTGKTNLPEGSTVQLKSYDFTAENPYLGEEMEVDENGEFSLELDLHEDSLDGAPLTLRLGYHPEHQDDEEALDIYGEEGEDLEGPFKQKYTNIKRTRYGAFTYALIDFEKGEEAAFSVREWDRPDDYGDLDTWIEAEAVDVHDDYYDITMKSNINELTRIKALMEIPGYEVAGVRGGTHVGPDGSFRFQIQRPDEEMEDEEDIIIVIEATSDAAIETEELYGEHGENFEGDLAETTKRGQKVQYKFNLDDVK